MTERITEPLPCRFCGGMPEGDLFGTMGQTGMPLSVAILKCECPKKHEMIFIRRIEDSEHAACEACTATWNEMMEVHQ